MAKNILKIGYQFKNEAGINKTSIGTQNDVITA